MLSGKMKMTSKEIRRHLEIRYSEVIEEKELGAWRIRQLVRDQSESALVELRSHIKILFPSAEILDSAIELDSSGQSRYFMVLFRILPVKKEDKYGNDS